MNSPFAPLSLPELDELLRLWAFKRPIESVVLRLVHSAANAEAAQAGAQLAIDRHGILRPGGPWADLGPTFVIDAVTAEGADEALDVQQQSILLEAIARVQHRFSLPVENAHVANGGDKPVSLSQAAAGRLATIETLKSLRAELARRKQAASERDPNFPFPNSARPIWTLIEKLKGDSNQAAQRILQITGRALDPLYRDLAPAPETFTPEITREIGDLTPGLLNDLRPHVVNLVQGRFSDDGAFRTTPADVDDIFATHLPNWARSRPAGEPIRVVLYAHGGLVSEESGLAIAANQIEWWKDNGVYPIHFVWETGLFETLGQILNPERKRALDLAAPTDFVLEELARAVGGGTIWSGMKRSAERASDAEGGARYLAVQLAAFCQKPEFAGRIELHAIGHSAGSIFHSHLIPAARQAGVPDFKSLQLLAPAIRVDAFLERLEPLIGAGRGIEQVTMFTMARPFELADNCAKIYRKSLLYLVRAALEPERRTPILGLEESLRGDATLRRLFNLDGQGAPRGEIVFSVTKSTTSRNASTSATHGGFDNDAPTMNSVARRILNRDDIKPFADLSRDALAARETAQRDALLAQLQPAARPPVIAPVLTTAPKPSPAAPGAKRALCVGINRYPTAPLAGCVNDAQDWARALASLGFSTELLLDEAATRDAIVQRLDALVRQSQAGETLVFQFAGHGTQLPDVDGDDKDDTDEALCPIDFAAGHFLIDDDLADVFDRIPDGVNVTMFADCCHSGTVTRFAMGRPPAARDASQRARYVVATPEMIQAHCRDRAGGMRAMRALRAAAKSRQEVLFCACRDVEVALESNGHGDFTTRAVPLLSAALGASNADFLEQVLRAFGAAPAQHPELHCEKTLRETAFLQPRLGVTPVPNKGSGKRPTIERALAIVSEAALSAAQ